MNACMVWRATDYNGVREKCVGRLQQAVLLPVRGCLQPHTAADGLCSAGIHVSLKSMHRSTRLTGDGHEL